jgi:hypothetical protein
VSDEEEKMEKKEEKKKMRRVSKEDIKVAQWIGKDPEAIEAANHAATSIQSSVRGYLARSGKKDQHLERMVDKIMAELMEVVEKE